MKMSGEDDKNNAIGRYATGSDIIDNMILSRQFSYLTNKLRNHYKENVL